MKKVLIPTLRFPPAGGVGLRRIIKIGKKLAESGVEVHYVTTANNKQINSYSKDINHTNIRIQKIPSLSLNNYINRYKENIFDKIISKLVYYITMPLFFVDYATLWGLVLIPYVCWYVHKEKISNVYVSGPAFSTVFYMALLKKIISADIKVICEWRDYWTDDYERQYIPPKSITKKLQVWMERFSIRNCDLVLAVTPSLLFSLKAKGGGDGEYKLIENGFDKDDFITASLGADNPSDKCTICYTGNIVDTRAEGLYKFLDVLKHFNLSGVSLEVCGELGYNVKKRIETEYNDLIKKNILIYHGLVSVQEAIQLVERSDFGLVLVQRQHPEALTSKFFEYCCARKNVIAIGPAGDLKNKMKQSPVGIFCELDDFDEEKLVDFIKSKHKDHAAFDEIIEKNDFTYLANLLKEQII